MRGMISSVASSPAYGQLELFEAPRQGMQRAFAQAGEAAQRISEGDVSPDNMVDLLEAESLAKANAAVLRTADDMIGWLFDEKA
jgi:hypothetical protein